MGSITLYSDMLLSEYFTTDELIYRAKLCVSEANTMKIHTTDWWIWWYILLELSVKRIAIVHKIKMNSNLHNVGVLLNKMTFDYTGNDAYVNDLDAYLRTYLTKGLGFSESVYKPISTVSLVDLRYSPSYIKKLKTLDSKLACKLLKTLLGYLKHLGV